MFTITCKGHSLQSVKSLMNSQGPERPKPAPSCVTSAIRHLDAPLWCPGDDGKFEVQHGRVNGDHNTVCVDG
uniref:DUF1263 domain-containing protein n=1 Tax=Panagrellus redivivus TaxID=6233 RepID=A0A7E4VL06_PANRE